MLRTTLRSLWQHKRRLLSTTVAVLLGVAFMTGTLVLGDTLDSSFDALFADINEEIDAEVRGPELFDTGFGAFRAPLDPSVVPAVQEVEGVANAAGYIESSAGRILDTEGEPIGATNGPPTLLQSWIDDPLLSGVELVDGRGPESDDEVALNIAAAEDGRLEIGAEVEVFTTEGTETFTLVGTYTIGGRETAGGTVSAHFTPTVAQDLAGLPGMFLRVVARTEDPDLTDEQLVERIADVVPGDAEVITGEAAAQELSDSITQGLSFFTTFLMIFAFIALAVGSFIIYNTFSILIAQRGKELALLRAIGATRRQVFLSVIVEAILVGLLAALLGIVAGIALAIGIQVLLSSFGIDLPTEGLTVAPDTIVLALVVGLVVTVFSAVMPARRATKVPPIAALRDVAQDTSGTSRIRAAIGIVILALGVVCLVPAFGEEPGTGALQLVGLGALLLLLAVIILGPVLALPLSKLLGTPLAAVRGMPGQLARENAARNPKRTASTAAALMIGVALVGFITIFATSTRASIDEQFSRGFRGDFVLQSSAFELGLPLSVSEDIETLDGVETVTSLRQGFGSVTFADGSTQESAFPGAVDPERYGEMVDVKMAEGSLEDLQPGSVVVDKNQAEANDLSVGDPISITFPNGAVLDLTVAAISDEANLFGTYVMHVDDWGVAVPNQTDAIVFVIATDGADLGGLQEQMDEIVDPFPTIDVLDREEFLGTVAAQLNTALNVIYGLLALSVIIALIGIANTLSLSIHERTRELGLLRAVGMTRSQLRSSVRWESAIISLIGTFLGLVLAFVLSYSLVRALSSQGLGNYEVPVTQVVVIATIFAVLGVLAAIRPARRAAKLDVLQAIATE